MFDVDPLHDEVDVFGQQLVLDVVRDKYQFGDEQHPLDIVDRVVDFVYSKDPVRSAREAARAAMKSLLWVPAGRILAGAGTGRRVTLLNCFVQGRVDDDLGSIFEHLKEAALTMQQGGGIGTDFSSLRPHGAKLVRTGSFASGPVSFMEVWDAMCRTIMSAGSRRGAMMATIHDWHPDLLRFVEAKSKAGVLTNFNVSVLVSDAFMDAVRNNAVWDLRFPLPRADGQHVAEYDVDGVRQYVYSRHKARDLWHRILRTTYEHAEPGVIFIDRINARNNLRYCETIVSTNPCGEQCLPNYGTCNLGAVNLARVVCNPFTTDATIDHALVADVVDVGVRFLDNVIDVTNYPLEEHRHEEEKKRRIGLGVTGLANMLQQLSLAYNSSEARDVVSKVMQHIALCAYEQSSRLARERGTFPLWNEREFFDNEEALVHAFGNTLRAGIKLNGLRNGVLLTIAPTGTTSIFAGNVSSGVEPVFAHKYSRRVLQPDGSYVTHEAIDYGTLLARAFDKKSGRSGLAVLGGEGVWRTATQLPVTAHVLMQATCQRWVDASISKTVNCPAAMTFEEFLGVYDLAYAEGCKGCTTYRPSDVRGAVLSVEGETPESKDQIDLDVVMVDEPALKEALRSLEASQRPDVLEGKTYKVRMPTIDAAFYVTITDHPLGHPFEIFVSTKAVQHQDMLVALTRMISAVWRRGGPTDFVHEELKEIHSVHTHGWQKGQYIPSLAALIGTVIERHVTGRKDRLAAVERPVRAPDVPLGTHCERCGSPSVVLVEGCDRCLACGNSKCG